MFSCDTRGDDGLRILMFVIICLTSGSLFLVRPEGVVGPRFSYPARTEVYVLTTLLFQSAKMAG